MIHVEKQPEPTDFDIKVRQPGRNFLISCPHPKRKDWHRHNYWRKISSNMYDSYNGICAYTGEWFSRANDVISLDHFQPKSRAPHLAYEWDNYRLTTQKTNGNKSDYIVSDPFEIESGWFTLLIPTCLIVPDENLPPSDQILINFTIEKLKLNSDDEYVQRRCDMITAYIDGDIPLAFLKRYFPFIASELERQGFDSVEKVGKYFKR